MSNDELQQKAGTYLQEFCERIASRSVGSRGNRDATSFFAERMRSFGFSVECPGFDCMAWTHQGADLAVGGKPVDVQVSPYSAGGWFEAPLVVVSSLDELNAAEVIGCILLLQGDLAREPLMPKNFTFYNPESHQRIIQALEEKKPAAIITATPTSPEMAGAVHPLPLFEDGDFNIPSVYLTEEAGSELAKYNGKKVQLDIRAQRMPSQGCNVVACKGMDSRQRVVCFAHIDSKPGTPGALDNASGVTILLLLAELLEDYDGHLTIELVALNGEDYYSNPGEALYLKDSKEHFDRILLGINLDGVGYLKGNTSFSLYSVPDELDRTVRESFLSYSGIVEGEPWVQGDHMLFVINRRPALALTSSEVMELMNDVIHTAQDVPDVVDTGKLVEAARALNSLLRRLPA